MRGALLLALAALGLAGPTVAAQADPIEVNMQDFVFEPATLVVTPGARITFRNLDGQPHTATSETPGFDTGNVEPGQSGTIVAPSAPGSYAYYCVHHAAIGQSGRYEGMVGVIEVASGSGAGRAATPAPGSAIVLVVILSLALVRADRERKRGRA